MKYVHQFDKPHDISNFKDFYCCMSYAICIIGIIAQSLNIYISIFQEALRVGQSSICMHRARDISL